MSTVVAEERTKRLNRATETTVRLETGRPARRVVQRGAHRGPLGTLRWKYLHRYREPQNQQRGEPKLSAWSRPRTRRLSVMWSTLVLDRSACTIPTGTAINIVQHRRDRREGRLGDVLLQQRGDALVIAVGETEVPLEEPSM